MAVFVPGGRCPTTMCKSLHKELPQAAGNQESLPTVQPVYKKWIMVSRRQAFVYSFSSLITVLASPPTWAEDKSSDQSEEEDKGILGAITTLFDPNEKTKSGKILPKAYLNSARDVVKNLRESLKEDPNDIAKFRRTADAAKESIRDYLNNWRGQQSVSKEESYVELEKVLRSLASFYSKAGPSAPLPQDVKSEILTDLDTAEKFL